MLGHLSCDCGSNPIPRHLMTFLIRHISNLARVAEACSDSFEPSQAVEMLYTIPAWFQKFLVAKSRDMLLTTTIMINWLCSEQLGPHTGCTLLRRPIGEPSYHFGKCRDISWLENCMGMVLA